MASPKSSPKSSGTSRGRAVTRGAGEFAAVEALRRMLPGPPAGEVWIGDDAAVVAPVAGVLLLTTDMAVAGVHADLDLVGLDDLGWRALAAAVSDIAAMGGSPHRAVVAVAGPPPTDLALLYEGVAACAGAHDCPVVGGDLSGATDVVVAVAVTGSAPTPGLGEPGPVRRDGARAGDAVLVTGALGAAAAGLRTLRRAQPKRRGGGSVLTASGDMALVMAHRRPRARLAQGEVARRAGAHAMIDVSDGLLADLGHVATASGVGFRLDTVPVAPGATRDEALGGGDDYELVLAAPDPDVVCRAFAAAGLPLPLVVGRCTADPGERVVEGEPAPAAGWEHRFG